MALHAVSVWSALLLALTGWPLQAPRFPAPRLLWVLSSLQTRFLTWLPGGVWDLGKGSGPLRVTGVSHWIVGL